MRLLWWCSTTAALLQHHHATKLDISYLNFFGTVCAGKLWICTTKPPRISQLRCTDTAHHTAAKKVCYAFFFSTLHQTFSALWNCFFRYPDMVLVYNIGQSVRKRKLWVTRISPEAKHSKQNRQRRKLLKPMVKIVANMHGNEVSFSSAFIEARRPTSKRVLILQGCRQRIEFGFGGLFAQGILRLGSKDTTTAQRYRLAHFTFHESGWVWICNSNM